MKRLQLCWATLQRSRRERFLALAEHARSWYSKFLHRRRLTLAHGLKMRREGRR
jgi:hypothetical protein